MPKHVRQIAQGAMAALLLLWACIGCSRSRPHAAIGEAGPTSMLILASPEMDELGDGADQMTGWEFSRNDHLLGDSAQRAPIGFMALEIRQREHLRTINGRPRDYSTTSIRTWERRLTP